MGAPDRPVICIAGDGGFVFALTEPATAVNYGIHVIVIMFLDAAFGASKDDQLRRFHGRKAGTALGNPSYAELARVKVEPKKLEEVLEAAISAKRPTVIEVPIPTWVPPFHVQPRTSNRTT